MSQAKRPKSTRPVRYDRTILDLHNGVNTTRSPIVEALWYSDGAFLEGALLLKDKEARGETPTLVEYYCLFLAAIQRNDRKTISASLAAARKHYAAEKLWITSMEGQVGAWSQTDTEAIAMLMESGEPLFQGLACRFQGSRCIKNSQRLQREEAPPEAVKAEQLKAAEYFEAGYEYVREVSVFEACRNKHELAQAYPIERMAEKIACSKEAIELAVKCGAMRYQFTGKDRYSELLRLQAASEFLEDQKARFLGDVFRTIKEARTIEEFAERTLDLLCRRSLLRIPQAAFVRRQGYTETVIKRHPAEPDFPVQDLTSIEIGSGYSIRVSTMTDPDGLLFFTRGLRHLFAAAEKRFNYQNPDQTGHSELPFRFGGLELHDLGYKPLYEEFEALKMSSVTEVIGLLGETGTGKSEFAEAFHRELFGQNKTFKAFNCMTLGTVENPAQDPLTETDFFGVLAGTFTGQKGPKASVFDMVGDGTLLLDEMGALPLKLQGEFLTLFEKREYHKRGADKDFPFDCRIMVATNRPIDRYAQEWDETGGIFRADLWERINHPVWLPPLRDVPLQIPYVAQVFAEKTLRGKKIEAK
ncbi:MAG TPA: sigma 54-interacting transcriptional regulator, partial [Acidobacteriota bacterium]|nr:sigma 54-interacting transcriptional regulator [Acidobacteriota bacterium]